MLYFGLAIGVVLGICMVIIFLAVSADLASRIKQGRQNHSDFNLPGMPVAVPVGINEQRQGSMNTGQISCHSTDVYFSEHPGSGS